MDQHQAYAEVEVMKMVMPLLAPAAGVVQFAMLEGAVLAAGDLVARLQLDDADLVSGTMTGTLFAVVVLHAW